MIRIILVLVMVMMTTTAKAENLLYSGNLEYFYRGDPTITKVEIDSTYSTEFQELIKEQINLYLDEPEFTIKSLNSTDTRQSGVLRFVNFNDQDFSWCNCGGYFSTGSWYRQVNNTLFATAPIIVTPENKGTLIHEIGHFLGLAHESPKTTYILKKRKNKKNLWLVNQDAKFKDQILGADQMMSYGARPTTYDLRPNYSDLFYFNVQAFKERDFHVIYSDNLFRYNGADLLFVSKDQKIPAVINGDFKETRDGYVTAVGYLVQDLGFITLPRRKDTYKIYAVPQSGKNNLPNPEDVSGLAEPKLLGLVSIKGDQVKFDKKARNNGFELLLSSKQTLKALKQSSELITGQDFIVK